MERAAPILLVGVIALGLLVGLQQRQLQQLEARLGELEEATPPVEVSRASAAEPRDAAAAVQGGGSAPGVRARPRPGDRRAVGPAGRSEVSVQEVLGQPGARSQIAEIVREEQEEASHLRMESRRRIHVERLQEQALEWVEAEGLEPAVAEELGGLFEGWMEQRFSLRGAVWEGEMTHTEAREEGRALREDLRADAEELVGEEAMGSLTEQFPMLQEGGSGQRRGPPGF